MSAKAKRDEGIRRATRHADEAHARWSEKAIEMLRAYLRRAKRPFMIEEMREYAEKRGLPAPPDKRAWGGICQRARSIGLIESVGVGRAKSSNLSLKYKWQKAA